MSRLSLCFCFASLVVPASPAIRDYQVGDLATDEVVTPIRLIVMDAQRTETLRRLEVEKVPAIWWFQSNAVAGVKKSLSEAFADMRERFLAEWKSEFAPLRLEAIPLARLEQQVAAFRREHGTFPLYVSHSF